MINDEQQKFTFSPTSDAVKPFGDMSSADALQRRWDNVHYYLNRARENLRAYQCSTTTCDSPSQGPLLVGLFDDYLHHNELALAFDTLCQAGEAQSIEGSFWLYCYLASRCMAMHDRAAAILRRYHQGTVDPTIIDQVNAAALEEVRQRRLGVTQQFFQVHELAEESIALTHVRPCRQRADSFLRVRGEPYYWVVQMERTNGGNWQAHWGYCSHRARVYLSITDEELGPKLVSDWLGIDPDESHEKGTPMRPRPGSRSYNRHHWSLESPAADCRDFHNRLEDLLTTIEPFAERLKQLQSRETISTSINAALYDSVEWTFNFGLSRSTVQQLSAAGLGIEFDLYHSGPLLADDQE